MRDGELICVGVGPGNHENLTLAVAKAIREADVLAIPVTKRGERGYAWECILPLIQDQKVVELHFPMDPSLEKRKQDRAAAAALVIQELEEGHTVVMPTIGDPAIYSTCFHVLGPVRDAGFKTTILPGITSFTAAAAVGGLPLLLQQERMAVVPSIQSREDLEQLLQDFEAIVIMKAWKKLELIQETLKANGRLQNSWLMQMIGQPEEKVIPLADWEPDGKEPYFSIVLVLKELA